MRFDEEMRASENLLASALGKESLAALVTDPQRRTIYCNEEFTRLTGYGIHELLGRNCDFLQGSGTDPKTIEKMRETLDAGLTYRGRVLNYRSGGTAFWNHLTISPVRDSQGVLANFVSVQRDVTHEVELEIAAGTPTLEPTLTKLPPEGTGAPVPGHLLSLAVD
ncbi:PAS domain-containing protein [Frigoribacterium sp. CG_9.8]|uniref:PAS domain-containing protein n=1 Tax=Frigoribacterium sp. CG_9.8 TaxID=2787733 RepID=UPI0018CA2BD9|nr:PAS domain-containing protein [Frigoribacterium sp. CG_9.8]MBG6107720.1 PAS domain S-box-containing protein [Frigoribacterium sp. CG_9.8]